MSPENSPKETQRQVKLQQFIFPNEYPLDLVRREMEQVIAHRFEDPKIETELDSDTNIGTIWHVEISYILKKPIKEIQEMSLEELELELLVRDRLPDEF